MMRDKGYIIFNITANDSMSSSIMTLLANTLQPDPQGHTHRELERARNAKGFTTELMVIADDGTLSMALRQAALVALKNMVLDQCTRGGVVGQEDWEILKANILQFLGRIWRDRQLTNILREVIHIIAERDYPQRWQEFLPQILQNIQDSQDFDSVASSVEALKAVASVCGRSVQHEVTLNSMCNAMFVPLFSLANKLFENYSPQTLPILVSIFKTLNLAVFYHMPTILINNIHQLMIFCKRILELPSREMEPLKVVTLKILVRLYSRHTTSNVSYKLIGFAQDFHQRYSNVMVETFVLQLLNPDNSIEIVNLSLTCLSCIYKNHEEAAATIDKHRQRLVGLCIQRFRVGGQFKSGQSIGSYITCLKEQRSKMVAFFTVLFSSNESILGDLIDAINSGDEKTQELALYVFGALGDELVDYPQLHGNMVQFIISYILPILSGNSSALLKARGCEVISAFPYLNLPGEHLQTIFQFIYSCLTESKEPYLNIYALEAFTHLIIKYEEFMKMIVPYLADILKVYTELMRQSNGQVYEVIKSFESFLANLDGPEIQPFASDLIKFLTDLFYEYAESAKNARNTTGDDSSQDDDDEDDDIQGACHGCIACIRQIISADNFPQQLFPQLEDSCLLVLIVDLLRDKDLPHFQEALNILNMLLFKRDDCLPDAYNQFFLICVYAIIGIPQDLANSNLPAQYKEILVNVCVDPDEDVVSNVVGLFRNFTARLKGNLRNCKDQLGVSFLQYLFKVVEHVNNSKKNDNQPAFKESDRWIIFTIYSALLEHQVVSEGELSLLLDSTVAWYQQASNQGVSSQGNLLLETLLMAVYYYPRETLNRINLEWFLGEILNRWETFNHEYQTQRLLIGICKLMELEAISNNFASEIVRRLPDLAERHVMLRAKENEKLSNEVIDVEEEAEEDLVAENTHLGLMPQASEERARQEELQKEDEREWEEEYNKYYYSPFCATKELLYLGEILGKSKYTELLSNSDQQRLSRCIQGNN